MKRIINKIQFWIFVFIHKPMKRQINEYYFLKINGRRNYYISILFSLFLFYIIKMKRKSKLQQLPRFGKQLLFAVRTCHRYWLRYELATDIDWRIPTRHGYWPRYQLATDIDRGTNSPRILTEVPTRHGYWLSHEIAMDTD